jgi:pimeloyl-ACP methyl ester carboxylesterase
MAWAFDYLVSGAIFRVLRASPYFGLVLLYFQIMLIWWFVLAAGGGWLIALAAMHGLGLGGAASVPIGVIGAIAIFFALRPLANRLFLIQINNHWPYLCAFARGEATCFDAPIEACAQRVIAAVRANDADEVIVVGHSGGGALAPAVIVRALELDPDIGRQGPPLVLVTLGSIAPGAALHPKAARMRAVFARLAVEPSVLWIDSQSRADVLNFWNFDPVEGIGARVDGRRCNPLIWKVRFGDMLSRQFYWRIRFNFFRLHYQFIMASDRRAPYDYFLLVCGPVPVAAWARDPNGVLAAFAADGSLAAGDLPGAARSAKCSV